MAGTTIRPAVSFDEAYQALDSALSPDARPEIVRSVADAPTLGASLLRLRAALRASSFQLAGRRISLERIVNAFDKATRNEGFHVLHDWDGKSDRVNEECIPVDVLDYVVRIRGNDAADASVAAILLDYYFVHLLELMSLRIWDEGDADANLDRIAGLLGRLQGPGGSGQPFAADAETLMLLATSHYERREHGYRTLLDRVRTLNADHQFHIALGHAASMGSHLRFGFEASYARDTLFMRDDNVADYPWLCYALLTLMREYARAIDESPADTARIGRIVEGLLNGLSADARAFVGGRTGILSDCERDRAEFAERFHAHRAALLEAFEPLRPSGRAYSPLSFFFNFSHNVRKGTVVDALLRGQAWPLSFNDLLTAFPGDEASSASKTLLAETLMTYARLNPDRIRGQLMPVIVYDPQAGRQAFGTTMRRLRE
jgi:hypothetical protein